MTALVFLIEQIAPGLYFFIGLGVVFYLRSWLNARFEYRATQYELERDMFRYQIANSLTAILFLAEFALIIVGIQQVVAPVLRQQQIASAVVEEVLTDRPFNTPTPSISDAGQIDASGIQIRPTDPAQQVGATPIPSATPVGTIRPNAPPPSNCETDHAQLQVPGNGMQVFEPFVITGTAHTEDFAFYRIELSGPSTFNSFAVYDEQLTAVTETGPLSQFNPAPYEPGWYEFRLMVFDITNTLRASCLVNIFISGPLPTPTPSDSQTNG